MAAVWVQFAPRQGRELVPAFLELVNAAESLGFTLGLPKLESTRKSVWVLSSQGEEQTADRLDLHIGLTSSLLLGVLRLRLLFDKLDHAMASSSSFPQSQ